MEVKIPGRGALDARGRASEFPARTRNICSRGSSVFNYGLVYTSLKNQKIFKILRHIKFYGT